MGTHELKLYSSRNFRKIPQLSKVKKSFIDEIDLLSKVFPFRVNNYVLDELIDWENIPEDPLFVLTFPQKKFLSESKYEELYRLSKLDSSMAFEEEVMALHKFMNPHPADQAGLNIPVTDGGQPVRGAQHKYNETILFFPKRGQTCHSYCTYCFRWPQFVNDLDMKFAAEESSFLYSYIESHSKVTDILVTGGDPMIMKADVLRSYLDPFLKKRPGNLKTIRIGTKSLAYWPYRYFADSDSDDLMELFSDIIKKGYHLSLMAHFSHPRELSTTAVEKAIIRLRSEGVQIRCQAPLIKHINDDSKIWKEMWEKEVSLGTVPYYMFVERDTGPKDFFALPLYKAYQIFTDAYKNVSGLCRTVRGPSMSAGPGKILIDGLSEINGEKVFALKFIQARNPDWVNRVFFAEYNEEARWVNELKPFGIEGDSFFYEGEYQKMKKSHSEAFH